MNCASPPPGIVSTKQQRDKYRARLMAAFEPHYHPDHCVPRYVTALYFEVNHIDDISSCSIASLKKRSRLVVSVQFARFRLREVLHRLR